MKRTRWDYLRRARKQEPVTAWRLGFRSRIINALLANPALLRLSWRMIVRDIRRRYGCSQELAHEALSEVHAVKQQ